MKKVNLTRRSGIYAIKNNINGKMYIGSSYNVTTRINAHFYNLKNNKGAKSIQKDFIKYGECNFSYEIIEEINNCNNLLQQEDYYIEKYNTIGNGYNTRKAVPRGRNDITTVVNDDIYDIIKSQCESLNITVSEWLRIATKEKLTKENVK